MTLETELSDQEKRKAAHADLMQMCDRHIRAHYHWAQGMLAAGILGGIAMFGVGVDELKKAASLPASEQNEYYVRIYMSVTAGLGISFLIGHAGYHYHRRKTEEIQEQREKLNNTII